MFAFSALGLLAWLERTVLELLQAAASSSDLRCACRHFDDEEVEDTEHTLNPLIDTSGQLHWGLFKQYATIRC